MDPIPGITEHPILITNDDGIDDDEEWHLIDFGRDEDYFTAYSIYGKYIQGHFAYTGGWAEQLATHIEIIDLFGALDGAIERPEQAGG